MNYEQCKGALALGSGCRACSHCFAQMAELRAVAVSALVRAGFGLHGEQWKPPVADRYSTLESRQKLANASGMQYVPHEACDTLKATTAQMESVLRELLAIEIVAQDTETPLHFHLQPGHKVERVGGALRIVPDETVTSIAVDIREGGEIAEALEHRYGLLPLTR